MSLWNSTQLPIQTWMSIQTNDWGTYLACFCRAVEGGGTQTIDTYQRKKAQRLHSSWSGPAHPGSVVDRRHLGSGSIWGLWGQSREEERRLYPGVKMGSVRRNQCWSMENGREPGGVGVQWGTGGGRDESGGAAPPWAEGSLGNECPGWHYGGRPWARYL